MAYIDNKTVKYGLNDYSGLFFAYQGYTFVNVFSIYENTQCKFVIMLARKFLLISGIAMLVASSLSAQVKKDNKGKGKDKEEKPAAPAPAAKPGGLQWANRDMSYHGQNYDVMDSGYYPKGKPSKQFHQYMEHQEPFPPRPRSMWEMGMGVGLYNLVGNIPSTMLWQGGGGGINLNVRKSLGYIFSMRLQYIYGVAKNMDMSATTGYDGPYTQFGYVPLQQSGPGIPAERVYRSTRMESSQMNLDLMFNAGNISFHRARNKISFFGFAGLGALGYKTRVNALNGQYEEYDFKTIVKDPNGDLSKIRKDLKKGMDKSYESPAPNTGRKHIMDKKTLDFAPSVGFGAQFKINKQFNFQIEDRYVFPMDPYLDGTRFGPNLGSTVGTGRSSDAINYFSVGINMNLKTKKAVEPLYWINPLDHGYNELSYPRHMLLPNPELPDKDEDGISDQFDKCPKTPKDLPVDAHGCPLDTDGDGVPDYKDKQLITPTECQPVDADGVGNCPCPDGCKEMVSNNNTKTGDKNPCGNIGAGSLLFPEKSNKINKGMELQLATLAAQMQANPLCKVVIMGGGTGSKIKEQKSWEHVNAVIEYMSDKNSIGRDRFIFKYGEAGEEGIVTYRPANVDEGGDSNVPPPHPNIK